MKRRHGSPSWPRTLRREYVRDRGRHDRCWDSVTVGKWAIINALRTEFDRMLRRFRESMSAYLYTKHAQEQMATEYEPPPRVRAKLRRRGEK